MTDGMAAVMGRIQDIQSRLGQLSPQVTVSAGTSTGAATDTALGGTSAQGFAGELAAAMGAGSTGGLSTGTTTAPGTAGGQAVVTDAKRYLGVPYVWGGTDPAKGLDCSGLVQRVYADLGVKLPRVSGDQARAGTAVASVAEARPGDIVAFGRPVNHVGIYVGDGKMIAAPRPGKNVRIEALPSTPTAIRRIITEPASSFAANGTSATSASTTTALGAGTPYGSLFDAASAKNDLPAGLLAAVAKAESGFNPKAVSSAGAQGLMQLMPATARGLGVNALDPAQAIDGAARLLKSNLRDFGSVPLALAAYNAGPGAVRRYGGIPPYAETQAYVARVQTYQKELAR